MDVVIIEDLWWRYPSYTGELNPWALRGVNLRVRRGEFLGITGPSGAGKTTLSLAVIGYIPTGFKIPRAGIRKHVKGRIEVMGDVTLEINDDKLSMGSPPTDRIGLVMQDPENQFLTMSLLHEVALGLQIKGLAANEIEGRVREALELVGLGHLYQSADKIHPMDLSGGQKQRVAIASFIAMRPEILILDEPTSDLDPKGKREVIETIDGLRRELGITIILIEHDPYILRKFCDRIALLYDGKIELVDEPEEFYDRVDLLIDRGIAIPAVSIISKELGASRIAKSVEEAAEQVMPYLKEKSMVCRREEKIDYGGKVIEIDDVWFRYEDGTIALRGVSFDVKRGDYLALLGPNGSGKTTLSKILAGIYRPWKGRVSVMGQEISNPKISKQLSRHIGYVFQNPDHQLFTRSVYDEVAYGPSNLGLSKEEIDVRVMEALEVVGLRHLIREDPIFLGKGQKQRLAVASILAMKPSILIVDEPTTGQDYRMRKSIMELMDSLHASGSTIMIITHDMELVAEHCKRAIVMNEGRVIFDGSVHQLFRSDDILSEASLDVPELVRLSRCVDDRLVRDVMPINVKEWLDVLKLS